jgi:7,8-dihydroneopterin aldolase/epimerase/oxygenase
VLADDRIILKDMQFYGFHGVNAEEQALGQPYLVDLSVELDLSRPGHTDQLTDTISYTQLYRSVKEVVEGQSRNLLEALAQSIATRILDQHPVSAVQVTVKKPRPPIKGSVVGFAAVEIHRTRG